MNKPINNPVYIHIGFHKTGSTFLQRRVFPNLPLNLIIAPDISYISDARTFVPEKFLGIIQPQNRQLKYKKLLISQEGLSGSSDGNPARDPFRIADRLKDTFADAKIIIVTRNPEDYILSLYAFRVAVRGLEYRSLEKYMESKREQLNRKLDYEKLINHYKALFGDSGVLTLKFEELQNSTELFTSRIAKFIGEELNDKYCESKENEGIRSVALLNFQRSINCIMSLFIAVLKTTKLAAPGFSWPEKYYFMFKRKLLNPFLTLCFGKLPLKQITMPKKSTICEK